MSPLRKKLHCIDFVEMVTDYVEGTLSPSQVRQIDKHLAKCRGCSSVLAQWRQVIHLCGRLGEEQVGRTDPAVRDQLMDAFRSARGP